MAINAEIEKMIIRRLGGNASAADDRSIEEWLEESETNRAEYEKIRRAWEASGAPAAKRIDVDAEWEQFRQRHFAQPKGRVISLHRNAIIRYAAAAVILLGLLVPGIYFSGSQTYSTSAGERLMVSLGDGSEVILGENTWLEVPRTFDWFSRELELNGEAIFEVAKNPEKPFRIDGPQTSTQVLGTAFRLIATEARNLISVTEGKVAYWSEERTDTLILTQGERGALRDGELLESQIATANYHSWKTGVYRFENEPVIDILKDLQDHYVFSINNLNEFQDVDCRFSGSFDNQSLEEVLEELSLTMGMEYELQDSVLHINKFYCD